MKTKVCVNEAALDFLVCPYCRENQESRLKYVQDQISPGLRCMSCERCYPITDGILDFCPGIEKRTGTGLAQKFMEHKAIVSVYEHFFRPAFTRLGSSIQYDEEISWLTALQTDIPVTAILDLACGTGKYSRLMNRLYSPKFIFAVDISLPMLQKSVVYAEKENIDNIIHIRGDAGSLPFRSGSFQRVNCFGALHLFPDITAAIQEIARVSAARAVFSCLTSRKTGRLFTGTGQSIFSKLFSFYFFDEDQLERELNRADFDSIKMSHKEMVLLFYCRKKDIT